MFISHIKKSLPALQFRKLITFSLAPIVDNICHTIKLLKFRYGYSGSHYNFFAKHRNNATMGLNPFSSIKLLQFFLYNQHFATFVFILGIYFLKAKNKKNNAIVPYGMAIP